MSRKEVLEQARARYCGRGKEGRSRLLDEICALCGYERKYPSKLLSGVCSFIGESGRARGGSPARYGEAERVVLKGSGWMRSSHAVSACTRHCQRGCLFMRSIMEGFRQRCGAMFWQ